MHIFVCKIREEALSKEDLNTLNDTQTKWYLKIEIIRSSLCPVKSYYCVYSLLKAREVVDNLRHERYGRVSWVPLVL